MKRPVTTQITLESVEVRGQTVHFRWREEPRLPFFRSTAFQLEFPAGLDISAVPQRFWWTVFMLCLHPLWALARPCKVHVPIALEASELGCWQRLLETYADSLDALNQGSCKGGELVLSAGARDLPPPLPLPEGSGCASAFSGGKDSLAQAGLLREMGFAPLLVTTTAGMGAQDFHTSPHRLRALAEMPRRTRLELLEVRSDLRAVLCNDSTQWRRWPLYLNELFDTFLYTAALAACAMARGFGHIFLASETEVSQGVVQDGKYLQHPHFMYSALTQAGLSEILAPWGMRLGSLTGSLQSIQVQELLSRRYADLADLQVSCWSAPAGLQACGICGECRRLAWAALAAGSSLEAMGIDLARMLNRPYRRPWPRPWRVTAKDYEPKRRVSQMLRREIAICILRIPEARIRDELLRQQNGTELNWRGRRALANFLRLQARERLDFPEPPSRPGVRLDYLELLAPRFREPLRGILLDQFETAPAEEYRTEFEALQAAIRKLQRAGVAAEATTLPVAGG